MLADLISSMGLGALTSQEQAAWVQAVASILAIAVAIAVPAVMRRQEQRNDQLRREAMSRDLALVLLPAVRGWSHSFSCYRHPESPLGYALQEQCYMLPGEIRGVIERLHQLGPAAKHLQRAVFLAGEIEANERELLGVVRGDTIAAPALEWFDSGAPEWDSVLLRLRESLELAEGEMRRLFGTDLKSR